jgi:hypothetical protein
MEGRVFKCLPDSLHLRLCKSQFWSACRKRYTDDTMQRRSNHKSASEDAVLLSSLPAVFQECWRRETSYEPEKWSPENPTHGQCAITALVIQDLLGGDLLRAKADGADHYWNRLPGCRELDLTRDQFGSTVTLAAPEVVSRDYVLSFSSTVRRYKRLSHLFATAYKQVTKANVASGNPFARAAFSTQTPKSRISRPLRQTSRSK